MKKETLFVLWTSLSIASVGACNGIAYCTGVTPDRVLKQYMDPVPTPITAPAASQNKNARRVASGDR